MARRSTSTEPEVIYHDEAEMEFLRSPEWRERIDGIGDHVATDAREVAPRGNPSHGGAASIESVTELDPRHGWVASISWDRVHYYMRFQELGTEYQRDQPFLRPALRRAAGNV